MVEKVFIFDLGGVIVDTSDALAIDFLKASGFENSDDLFNRNTEHCLSYEKGLISVEDFLNAIADNAIANRTKQEKYHLTRTAWLKIIVAIPKWRIDFLLQLAKQSPLYVLSNNNVLHKEEIAEICQRQYGVDFFAIFQKVYLSNEIGLLKPDAAAFEYVLNDINKSASECIFIDDRIDNIITAQQLGFETYHVEDVEQLRELVG
jgi:HAD superfamily hydrolase (TIGR01509 family)